MYRNGSIVCQNVFSMQGSLFPFQIYPITQKLSKAAGLVNADVLCEAHTCTTVGVQSYTNIVLHECSGELMLI